MALCASPPGVKQTLSRPVREARAQWRAKHGARFTPQHAASDCPPRSRQSKGRHAAPAAVPFPEPQYRRCAPAPDRPPARRWLRPAPCSRVGSRSQQDCTVAGPLLVIAGAGSGKTNTLAHRVAHLIVNGADPRRILLMTFSRRAANVLNGSHSFPGPRPPAQKFAELSSSLADTSKAMKLRPGMWRV
jgi:hypothetical protein